MAYSDVDLDDITLGIYDLASSIKVFLFDVQENRNILVNCLRRLFQNDAIVKIFQGCSGDANTLYSKYGILLKSVFDTAVAHKLTQNSEKCDLYFLYEHYVGETTNRMKKDIKKQYIGNPRLWTTRPLSDLLIYYAAFDAYALIRIYYAMLPQIDPQNYTMILRESNNIAEGATRRFVATFGHEVVNSNVFEPPNNHINRSNFNNRSFPLHRHTSYPNHSNHYSNQCPSYRFAYPSNYHPNHKCDFPSNYHLYRWNRHPTYHSKISAHFSNYNLNDRNNHHPNYSNYHFNHYSNHHPHHYSNHYSNSKPIVKHADRSFYSSRQFSSPNLPNNFSNHAHQSRSFNNNKFQFINKTMDWTSTRLNQKRVRSRIFKRVKLNVNEHYDYGSFHSGHYGYFNEDDF